MSLSDRSSLPTRSFEHALALLVAPLALLTLSCEETAGSGAVNAHFLRDQCESGFNQPFADYSFEAGYLATERFSGILEIIIQEHKVDVEESDGLVIRFSLDQQIEQDHLVYDRDQIIRTDLSQPLTIRTSTVHTDANVALSLFKTCPMFPTHYAHSGLLTLDKITLAADPADTGTGERLSGTVTATLTRAIDDDPVGTLQAFFDFDPPRRPLTDFK